MGIFSLVTMGFDLLKGWVQGKVEKQRVKTQAETRVMVAKAEAEASVYKSKAEADIQWDRAAVEQMDDGWKDEWFAILLSVPAILAFCGEWGRDVVTQGFQALETMPEWYVYAFLTAIAASFGMRQLVKLARK